VKLAWNDTNNVEFDSTVVFSKGYNFFGLDYLRLEAVGQRGNYLIWPEFFNGTERWSVYRDSDGCYAFEQFASQEEAMAEADKWESAT